MGLRNHRPRLLNGSASSRFSKIVCADLVNKEGVITLPKTDPWYSILSDVHHNNTNCNTGNNIESENRREGTGNRPLCQECADLNAAGS
jgi:hypothetical protein